MRLRGKAAFFLLVLVASATRAADPKDELKFAQMLGRRGLDEMAVKVLDDMIHSGDATAARYGEYGKALLTKERASLAKARYIRALDEGTQPPIERSAVLALYEEAEPKIQAYTDARKDDARARFLLGELRMERAEFLVGADYPEGMEEEKAALLSENKSVAEKLFEGAIKDFGDVYADLSKKLGDDPELDDPDYISASTAALFKAIARLRWALIYPKGPKFQYISEQATEELDEFYNEHYSDTFGAFAMLELGRCYYERGVRLGEADDAETATNYFNTLWDTVKEDPTAPATTDVLARAFYWYAKGCNAIAAREGALKKAQPRFYEKTIRSAQLMRQKLSTDGMRSPWALRAQLEAAGANAAREDFDAAVATAGEVLSQARVVGQLRIAKTATALLTQWVAHVSGAGALDAGLLYQIGESLASQGRVANAVTFFEKAVTAAGDAADEKEQFAYPARLRIARTYYLDKRYYVAAAVGWALVQEYIQSGQEEESAFGQVASEACNVARLGWQKIADATKRSADQSQYESVRATFRAKFPSHPQNSDAAYANAMEEYNKGKYEAAAKAFLDIGATSKSYWSAMRKVPICYRRVALSNKDSAKAWHEKCLAASENLIKIGSAKSAEDPKAARAVLDGKLMRALSLSSLQRWEETLTAIVDFFTRYPNQYPKQGLEFKTKIDAELALGKVGDAERTLADLRKTLPTSRYIPTLLYDVFNAVRAEYKKVGPSTAGAVIANRAADLLDAWVKMQKKQDYRMMAKLGSALRDARRYQEAGAAFEGAATMVAEPRLKQSYTLKAAEMNYRALKTLKETNRGEYLKGITKARELFTNVIITDKSKQKSLLGKLSKGWLTKEQWALITKNPNALLTTAEIFTESSPPGLDGRWIAVRLCMYMQQLTVPVPDPAKKKLDAYISTWWNGAQLMCETYIKIAESGNDQLSKKAGQRGYDFAKRVAFQYPKMDGEERVNAIKQLELRLKRLTK